MGKLKDKYADEIINEMEKVKNGAWIHWIDRKSKDAVVEVCQNVVEDWCGRNIDHVKDKTKDEATAEIYFTEEELTEVTNGIFLHICSLRTQEYWNHDKKRAARIENLEKLYAKVKNRLEEVKNE